METIYQKIKKAVESANIKHIVYKKGYPTDMVELDFNPMDEEHESDDSLSPLVRAMRVIISTINAEAEIDDDIRVCFCHLPGEEDFGISIGDGRR